MLSVKRSDKAIREKLTDDIIFVLKKDLNTQNNIFKAGTRVVFEEKYRTVYHVCYNVYSADKTDYMYIHRTEELKELADNLKTDVERTDQYQIFLTETHVNASAIIIITCFVVECKIDCTSVDECGFAYIGLGSTSNIRKIPYITVVSDVWSGCKDANELLVKDH